jgi:hypothetical protein
MGLGPGDAAKFFAPRDLTGSVCDERARLLSHDAESYAAMTPEAEPALRDTRELPGFPHDMKAEAPCSWDQLLAIGRALEPDFVWMHPDARGVYRLVGGVVCFPSSWALRDKLGRSMSEIHEPVPGLNQSMGRQIDTFLVRLKPGVAWTRENAGFSRDADLNHHPSSKRRRLDPAVGPEEVFVRLESQLLLKFARSGSILFGIRVEVFPLVELKRRPGLPERMARSLETIADDAAAYKGIADARARIAKLLHDS